jgi:hypothetical protein
VFHTNFKQRYRYTTTTGLFRKGAETVDDTDLLLANKHAGDDTNSCVGLDGETHLHTKLYILHSLI